MANLSFSEIASQYDTSFSDSPIGKLQRARVHHFLKKSIPDRPSAILEINCGTGVDAIWLAGKGHHVTATDQSAEMVKVLSNKIQKHYLKNMISVKISAFENLKMDFSSQTFDVIFSNFGGLNCISKEDLSILQADLYSLLKPEGKLITVFMGKKCLWERFYFAWKGNFNKAFRRDTIAAVEVNLGTEHQQTWYFSPQELKKVFNSGFKIRKLRPVGLLIPPSYLNNFFRNKRVLLNALVALEKIFSFSFLSNQSDHFYMEMQKID